MKQMTTSENFQLLVFSIDLLEGFDSELTEAVLKSTPVRLESSLYLIARFVNDTRMSN